MKEYFDRNELCRLFDVQDDFLTEIEAENLVKSMQLHGRAECVYPLDQVERVRIIANLVQEMEVNLPGCEVILEMRSNILEMQRRFDSVIEALISELRARQDALNRPGAR